MVTKRTLILSFLCLLTLSGVSSAATLTGQQQLGKYLFFDQTLSINSNQACSVCHGSDAGWTGPEQTINQHGGIYKGSIPGRFGNRKPPSAAYAAFSPIFRSSRKAGGIREFIGGNFWDGRATGEKLGNPAADQAQGPFLNPLEQALPDPSDVVSRVCAGNYANLFLQICGQDACGLANTNAAFNCLALAIAAYEASREVSPFTSKFDAYRCGQGYTDKAGEKGAQPLQR